jgi:cell wall-associated NlpC family hydrolase
MSEADERAAVITEARTWIKTPWRHAAAIKGAGVDCAMLLARVFIDVGLVPEFDPRPYPPDWYLHRSGERFLGFLLDRSHQVEKPEPADVIMLRVGRAFAHGGIVSCVDPLTIIHSFRPVGGVIEEEAMRNRQLNLGAALYASFWS